MVGFTGGGKLHLDEFRTEIAPQYRRSALLQRRFVNVELIGIHRPLHHGFAETIGSRDEHYLIKTGFGVEREHHAGSTDVAAHHALHPDRQRHFGMNEPLMDTIGNSAVVVERGKYLPDGCQQIVQSVDIEKGFLLPGERGIGQIFGGSRGTHRHGNIIGCLLQQLFVSSSDLLLQSWQQRRRHDPAANLCTGISQCCDIFNIQRGKNLFDALRQTALRQEITIGSSGCGKTAGNPHPGLSQLTDHLPERSVLATDAAHISHAQLVQPDHIF